MELAPRHFIPLKDLVFRILVALAGGERHGWSLVQSLDESSGGTRLLPGHLYRTLDRMLDDGLIQERSRPDDHPLAGSRRGATPSRFFQLTALGREVAKEETRRLEALVQRSRAELLMKGPR